MLCQSRLRGEDGCCVTPDYEAKTVAVLKQTTGRRRLLCQSRLRGEDCCCVKLDYEAKTVAVPKQTTRRRRLLCHARLRGEDGCCAKADYCTRVGGCITVITSFVSFAGGYTGRPLVVMNEAVLRRSQTACNGQPRCTLTDHDTTQQRQNDYCDKEIQFDGGRTRGGRVGPMWALAAQHRVERSCSAAGSPSLSKLRVKRPQNRQDHILSADGNLLSCYCNYILL